MIHHKTERKGIARNELQNYPELVWQRIAEILDKGADIVADGFARKVSLINPTFDITPKAIPALATELLVQNKDYTATSVGPVIMEKMHLPRSKERSVIAFLSSMWHVAEANAGYRSYPRNAQKMPTGQKNPKSLGKSLGKKLHIRPCLSWPPNRPPSSSRLSNR
jgi:hypothetical protein